MSKREEVHYKDVGDARLETYEEYQMIQDAVGSHADPELVAIVEINDVLSELEPRARGRIARYFAERYA